MKWTHPRTTLCRSMSDCKVPFLTDGGCGTITNLVEPSLPSTSGWSSPIRRRPYLGTAYEITCITLQVNSFVGAFHDAVILYALALNDTLTAGEDPRNGTAVTRRMWNRTFKGMADVYVRLNHLYVLVLRAEMMHYRTELMPGTTQAVRNPGERAQCVA